MFAKLHAYLGNQQVLSLAGNLTVSVMSIVSVSLLFRVLSVPEVGVWVLFMSVVGLADSFRAGFLTTAFIRARSGAAAARVAEVTGSAWVIALLITGGLVLLNLGAWLVLGSSPDPTTRVLLHWFGVVLVVTLPHFMAASVMQSQIRFDRILYIRLLSQGLFVVFLGALLLLGEVTLIYVVYSYVGASLATSLLVLLLGWARISSLPHQSGACIRELAHFGKYSVGSYVGANLLRSSDTFIISYMLGPAPLAVYNLAGRFMEIVEIPLRSFVATAMPAMSAAFNQGRRHEVARLLRKNAGMLTCAFIPVIIGTILLADIPVQLIGGAKYQGSEAANLLRISMVLALLYPIDRFVGVTLDVVNQPRLNMLKVFLMLGVNVAGDVAALLLFGNIYGVAVASLPTGIVGFIFGYLHLKKYLPLSIRHIMVTGFSEIRLLARKTFDKFALVFGSG
ncbi:oligosaccharide flippase family protein [Hymenobacter actinosclerus]|uniref:Membrane protein involved in the export of O-antigen and teichoic acid n=1 Tax=Hymenobacter actinosclerus TaxID=82805 RepID=A0A1I0J369_9BACT|nr:oligosaccharide flippase family protein [Hymenobacter actinosclerus]SEU04230.1 Membrane protein involved in the export of O-antigen and teichoic acid [Hymenobacter actinosclerus]